MGKALPGALLIFALSFVSLPSYGMINEVMSNPTGSEAYNEWVELYSGGESLEGWKLCGADILPGYVNRNGEITRDTGFSFAGYAIITDGGSGSEVIERMSPDGDEPREPPATHFHVSGSSMCGGLRNEGGTITLTSADGGEERFEYLNTEEGKTSCIISSASSIIYECEPTFGYENPAARTEGQRDGGGSEPRDDVAGPPREEGRLTEDYSIRVAFDRIFTDEQKGLFAINSTGCSGRRNMTIDLDFGNFSKTETDNYRVSFEQEINCEGIAGMGGHVVSENATLCGFLRISDRDESNNADCRRIEIMERTSTEGTMNESLSNSSSVVITNWPQAAAAGTQITISVRAYRGDTRKFAVYAYVTDERKLSSTHTFYAVPKFSNHEYNATLDIRRACTDKDARLVVEGIDSRAERPIRITTAADCPQATQSGGGGGGNGGSPSGDNSLGGGSSSTGQGTSSGAAASTGNRIMTADAEYELISYNATAHEGDAIESMIMIRSRREQQYEIYSYVFREKELASLGGWTGNSQTVALGAEEREIRLTNVLKNTTGNYSLRIRIKTDAKRDITKTIEILNKESLLRETVRPENETQEAESRPDANNSTDTEGNNSSGGRGVSITGFAANKEDESRLRATVWWATNQEFMRLMMMRIYGFMSIWRAS